MSIRTDFDVFCEYQPRVGYDSVKGCLYEFNRRTVASKSTWEYIIINYRLPKAITAVLVGTGLSISGLLMQTLFRNPLAGPYVLGLSSGASLGVAFVILGAGFLPSFLSEIAFHHTELLLLQLSGVHLFYLLVLLVSQKLRDTMAILIVGLMFGSFTTAIVSVLTYFSTAEQLQKFTFWSMGSLGNLSWATVGILAICVLNWFAFKCCKH